MFPNKLRELIDVRNLSLRKVEKITGISNAHLSMMRSGKRPISTSNWIKILTGVEQLSTVNAKATLARWQIEAATRYLPHTEVATLAQTKTPYITAKDLEQYLIKQGLTTKQITEIKKQITTFCKKNKQKQ